MTGVIVKGEGAAGALKQIASASIPAKVGLASVAVVAANLAVQVAEIIKNYGAYRAELAKHAALQASINQLEDQKAKKLKAISDATGVVVKTMQELDDAVAAGKLVFDQASGSYLSAEQVQKRLSGALKETNAQLAAADATRIVAEFEKANSVAGETEKAIQRLAELLQFKDVKGASGFTLAMEQIGQSGALTAKQFGDAWQQALAKLNTGELGALRANLEEAARTGIISAQQLANANDQILGASFAKLGVNSAQALGKISDGAQEAINAIGLIADSAAAAGVKTGQAAQAVEMAFAAAVPKADSLEAIAALEKQLSAMGAAGKISAEGIERTKVALAQQRAVIEGQLPGIQSLAEALRQLGVKPQSDLKDMAAAAKAAFNTVSTSGTATQREIDEAWRAMAQSAIDANNGVADASLQAQAAQHGMVIQADEGGKAIVKSMDEAAKSAEGMGHAAKNAGKDAADGADEAADAADELKKKQQEVTAAFEYTWVNARAAASKYRDEAVRHADEIEGAWQSVDGRMINSWQQWNDAVNNHFLLLGRLADEYASALDDIDARQQKLNDTNSGAARGVADLELRLIELNGTEDEIAQARYERDQAEVKRQIELQKLELERAAIRKEDGTRIQQEIDLLNKQLGLMERVFDEEKKQAKARERDKNSGKPSGGDGGGSGGKSGGEGSPGRTVINKPEFHIHGITDPAQIARAIAPELTRLQNRAR